MTDRSTRSQRIQASAPIRLAESTGSEFAEAVERQRTLVLPVGSVEQHGPHLPITTDVKSVEALAEFVARERDIAIAPAIHYGYARPMSSFPGTVTLSSQTFERMMREILAEFLHQGFKSLLVLNGHYENLPFVMEAAELASRDAPEGARIVTVNWWDVLPASLVDELFGESAPAWADSHGGVVETSLALAIAPEGVRGDRLADTEPVPARPYHVAPTDAPQRIPDGVSAQLTASSSEAGERLRDATVRGLVNLIDEAFG